MGGRKNPDQYGGEVDEVVLDARWCLHNNKYELEVYVVDAWRAAGSINARKPRKLTMQDLKKVAKSVRINTGGEVTVVGLLLEE